jgi:SDR family mycofactocin-dependent oxidoreductase
MGRVDGKVAFITGAGRGQGRSHAVRLAEEGADIIAVDICDDIDVALGPMSSEDDLAETARLVEATGQRVVTANADVRNIARLKDVVDDGVSQLGGLDVVVANAGILTMQPWDEVTPEIWQVVIDVNLTGVWKTCAVTAPHLVARGGGSIILTSSSAGIKGQPFLVPYVAAKHGVVGLMKALTNELAEYNVRVNTIHPTGVNTPMGGEEARPLIDRLVTNKPNLGPIYMNALPVQMIDPIDISNGVLFLASDEARYVTGLQMTVDAGNAAR